MNKHTPWTQEEAEKAAKEYCKDWPSGEVYHRNDLTVFFEAGVAWAAKQIEKCPSLYSAREGSRIWGRDRNKYDDTMEAKLVGVREVEK